MPLIDKVFNGIVLIMINQTLLVTDFYKILSSMLQHPEIVSVGYSVKNSLKMEFTVSYGAADGYFPLISFF